MMSTTGAKSLTTTTNGESEMNVCKTCKWYQWTGTTPERDFARCMHPRNVIDGVISPVTGESLVRYLHPYCCDMRRLGDCGPEGKWFEVNGS
jgi:hypothetical protein